MRTEDLISKALNAMVTVPSQNASYQAGDSPGCRPSIEIAWDQWARTRIKCDHGVFEAVSDFLNLQESFERAAEQFNAYDHIVGCYKETPIPQEWLDEGTWEAGETSECDLWDSHEGPCKIYTDDDEEKAIRDRRIVMCVPCRQELHFIDDPRSWVHKKDNSDRCKPKKIFKKTNKWKPVPY